jgi:outer membrane lipoprotein SlyB
MNTVSPSTIVASRPAQGGVPRYVWALVATAAVAVTALAGTMTWKALRSDEAAAAAVEPQAAASAAMLPASEALAAAAAPLIAPGDAVAPTDEVSPPPKVVAKPQPRPQPKPAPVAQHHDSAPAPSQQAEAPRSGGYQPAQAAPVCTTCGVIESVQAVQHKGEGTGMGAIAGGVLGGVLGHQVGGGNGRRVATVVGAVGGGLAGHEIEKRARSETSYSVKVHMDDGSTRTVTQSTAPTVGQRVTVDGSTLRASSTPMPQQQGDSGARTWQTSSRP